MVCQAHVFTCLALYMTLYVRVSLCNPSLHIFSALSREYVCTYTVVLEFIKSLMLASVNTLN